MDENNVVTTEPVNAADIKDDVIDGNTETAKTEPVKTEKTDTAEVKQLKAALSRANSQAADYKRQLREKQTADEREKAERAEKEKADAERLAELERIVAVSDYEKKCLALNFDAELAEQTANALADGNMDSVFDCLKAFVEATKTRLNNEALNRQPGLSAGIPPTKGNTEDEITAQLRRYAGLPVHR